MGSPTRTILLLPPCIIILGVKILLMTYFFVNVTSLRATPFGVRGPEKTNLLTSFFKPESISYVYRKT